MTPATNVRSWLGESGTWIGRLPTWSRRDFLVSCMSCVRLVAPPGMPPGPAFIMAGSESAPGGT